MTDAADRGVRYEPSDAEPRLIPCLAAGVALFLLLSPVALRFLFPTSVHRTVIVRPVSDIPGPRLQLDPRQDLAALRRAEEAKLSGYGWVDRERKLVRIPIERALAVTLERGLPGWRKP